MCSCFHKSDEASELAWFRRLSQLQLDEAAGGKRSSPVLTHVVQGVKYAEDVHAGLFCFRHK